MTSLIFIGARNGRMVAVLWTDGELAGDTDACRWILYLARSLEGHIVGPVGGPYSSSDHLRDPYAAASIIRSIFPGQVRMDGALPPRVAPKGAIQ